MALQWQSRWQLPRCNGARRLPKAPLRGTAQRRGSCPLRAQQRNGSALAVRSAWRMSALRRIGTAARWPRSPCCVRQRRGQHSPPRSQRPRRRKHLRMCHPARRHPGRRHPQKKSLVSPRYWVQCCPRYTRCPCCPSPVAQQAQRPQSRHHHTVCRRYRPAVPQPRRRGRALRPRRSGTALTPRPRMPLLLPRE